MRVSADERRERRQEPGADTGQGETARAPERRQQAALRKQLADEPAARCADRRPDRELPPPHAGAYEQQVRDVRTGNQEHAADRAQQHQQRTFEGAAVALRIDRHNRRSPALVRIRVGRLEAAGDGVELGLRGLARHPGPQAAPDGDRVLVPAAEVLVDRERHPHLEVRLQKVEAARQHADDGERPAVDQQRLADDARVAAVAAPPQAVGQDDHPFPPGLLLFGHEGAAESGLHAQHREERRRDADAADLLGDGVAARGPGDGIEPVAPGDHVVERPALSAPVEEVAGRRRDVVLRGPALCRIHVADAHEAFDVLEGRRPEEEVVDDGEDGGIRADPEGQGQHGDEREAGIPARAAQRVPEVADQVLQWSSAACIADRLPDGLDAAQTQVCLSAGLARFHARAQVLLRFHLQVEAQFLRGLVVLVSAAEQTTKPSERARVGGTPFVHLKIQVVISCSDCQK